MDTLIAEDVMLLLMDDETGVPAAAGTLFYTLGGAVLVDLALRGRVEADPASAGLTGVVVTTAGEGPVGDPLLQAAYDKVAEKPRGVQTLLATIGPRLREPVVDRLLERGLVRREDKRVLGLFRTTALPTADPDHETALRARVRAALVDGVEPDSRTAAVIGLVSASGALPALRPPLAWSSAVAKRAKEIEDGDWGAAAVATAVTRTAAAIAASSAAAVVTAIT